MTETIWGPKPETLTTWPFKKILKERKKKLPTLALELYASKDGMWTCSSIMRSVQKVRISVQKFLQSVDIPAVFFVLYFIKVSVCRSLEIRRNWPFPERSEKLCSGRERTLLF